MERDWLLRFTLESVLSSHEPLALRIWREWGVDLGQFHCGGGEATGGELGAEIPVWSSDDRLIPLAWESGV